MTRQYSLADLLAVTGIVGVALALVRLGIAIAPEVASVDGTILAAGLLVAGVSTVAFIGIVQGS